MKVYAVQMEIVSGNPKRNFETMDRYIGEAKKHGADLVIFPDCCLFGGAYPEKGSAFAIECISYGYQIAALANGIDILFGNIDDQFSDGDKVICDSEEDALPPCNHAYYAAEQKLTRIKSPFYFPDELEPYPLASGRKIGIFAGNHDWNLLGEQLCPGDFFINISSFFYRTGEGNHYRRDIAEVAEKYGVSVLHLNAVGVHNEGKCIKAFAGESSIFEPSRKMVYSFPAFEPRAELLEFKNFGVKGTFVPQTPLTPIAEKRKALTYMIRASLRQMKIPRVVIGVSGGIDSAVNAVLHADALGAENVYLVNLPTRFNSETTKNAAGKLAENLGCSYLALPMTGVLESCRETLNAAVFSGGETVTVEGIHFENLQARLRSAVFLSTIASVLGAAFTCNGNKTEVMAGYCTLYGDTAGIFCALGDLWKTEVYELAREINRESERIPEASIEIPASAELSEAQNVDEGKGDPIIYAYHDRLFRFWMEENRTLDETLEALDDGALPRQIGFSETDFRRLYPTDEPAVFDMRYWWRRYRGIALAKRIQMPPILSVSSRSFGEMNESQIDADL
ncbi:MAG: NAD(+) synthase [Fibrobacter sp.]|jgi:NAD+ synthase (glutamine-hydrolysing)|nr:NAD(+) synthase [Fibrobacter sp.]